MGTKSTLNTKKAIHCLLRSRWSLAAGRDKGEDYREWRFGHAQGGVCQGSEVRLSIVFFVFLFFFKPSSAALSWWNRDSTGLRLLGQGRQGHWLTRASDTFTGSETERRTIAHPSTTHTHLRGHLQLRWNGSGVCWDQLILRPLNFRGDSKWYTSKRLRQNKTPNNNNNNNSVLLSIDG